MTDRDRINAESKAYNEKQGFPRLVGSEKQIAWAETIRAETHRDYLAMIEDLETNIRPQRSHETAEKYQDRLARRHERIEQYKRQAKLAFSQTNSSWWIDNRDDMAPRWNGQISPWVRLEMKEEWRKKRG